jgi:hypothetical protein
MALPYSAGMIVLHASNGKINYQSRENTPYYLILFQISTLLLTLIRFFEPYIWH